MSPKPKIIFFHAKDNATKIRLICQFTQEAVLKGKKILLTAANEEAAKYIDTLLWRLPEESFLPHVITSKPTKEWVAITYLDTHNFNQAQCLLNLGSSISPIYQQFEEIYELYDETNSQKIELAQKKIKEYQEKGLSVLER